MFSSISLCAVPLHLSLPPYENQPDPAAEPDRVYSTIVTTLIGFLSTIYFAHILGPAPLGVYFLFIAYFGIFNLVGDGGFGGAAVKRISEGKDQDEYFSAFVFIRVVLLALSITALLCAEPYLKDITSSGIFFWLLLALIIAVFQNSTGSGVYGSGKVGIHRLSLIVEWLFRVLIQVIFIYLGYSAAGLAGGFVAGLLVGGIVQFRYFESGWFRFRLFHVKNLSTFSFWIFLTSSGSLIFSYTDTILISFFMNTADIGIYRYCTPARIRWLVFNPGVPDRALSKNQQLGSFWASFGG